MPPYPAVFSVVPLCCLPSKPLPLVLLCLHCSADEMTVGKVYAALMIFDFYKQNKTTRDQIHQAPGGLSQVQLWETDSWAQRRGRRREPPQAAACCPLVLACWCCGASNLRAGFQG